MKPSVSVICEDIPNSKDVEKWLYGNVLSMVRIRYVGESKIPGIDAPKLAPCVVPVFYKRVAADIESFEVNKDDIWVTSYPKCGKTASMSVICEDIPHSKDVVKSLCANMPSLVRARYVGESKIPGIDATKLAPCILPVFYKKIAADIESFKVYEDDVWVTSFPKCGTTWTQEMIWLIANDLDFDGAKRAQLTDRYAFLEFSSILNDSTFISEKNSVQIANDLPRPRFIKSHHPITLLPTEFWTVKPKLVYVARNPRDAAISFYHHYVNVFHYKGTMEDFLDTFLNDLVFYSPFKDHILDYWELRNEPNILFITYEEMSRNMLDVLRKVATFFGKTYTDDQLHQAAKHLSFSEMRKNDAVNLEHIVEGFEYIFGEKRADPEFRFLRRGQVDSAKDEMPVEYQEKFDAWIGEAFKGSDFQF